MEREALKLATDGLERILGSFEKDGKVVMKSMIRNELFAEINLLLKKAKKTLAQPAQEPDMQTGIAYQKGFYDGKQAALAQPAQEPVQEPFGWYSAQEDEFMTHKIRKEHERLNSYTHINGKFDLALYTASPLPVQRQWIWLSDADIAEVVDTTCQYTGSYEEFLIKKAEQKIRSMNNG